MKQIDFFLNYPTDFNGGHIRAVNTVVPITGHLTTIRSPGAQVGPPAQACARTPVCGYPPQTLQEIHGKALGGKAKIIDGRKEIAHGLIIHPAFRGHTYGSQLLQVNTPRGQLVFGSDTYSSWTGIRDWLVANIQQTDTIQQFLAYEKCYVLTSKANSFNNCISAHEPISYTAAYPITSNWWNSGGALLARRRAGPGPGDAPMCRPALTGRCADNVCASSSDHTRSLGRWPGPNRLARPASGSARGRRTSGSTGSTLAMWPIIRCKVRRRA